MTDRNDLAAALERKAALEALYAYQREYLDDYELRADEGDHKPNYFERFLIEDAINGLVADETWLNLHDAWRALCASTNFDAWFEQAGWANERDLALIAWQAGAARALAGSEPVAWRREWDGDVSDLGQWIYVEDPADCEPQYAWQPLYAAPGVPDGWVRVPKEPTEEMLNAPNTVIQPYAAKLIWQRMLSAAPSVSQPTEQYRSMDYGNWIEGDKDSVGSHPRTDDLAWKHEGAGSEYAEMYQHACALEEQLGAQSVPIPKNADMAELMLKLAHKWLVDNAPERLREQPAPSVSQPTDNGKLAGPGVADKGSVQYGDAGEPPATLTDRVILTSEEREAIDEVECDLAAQLRIGGERSESVTVRIKDVRILLRLAQRGRPGDETPSGEGG